MKICLWLLAAVNAIITVNDYSQPNCMGPASVAILLGDGSCESLNNRFGRVTCSNNQMKLMLCNSPTCSTCTLQTTVPAGVCGNSLLGGASSSYSCSSGLSAGEIAGIIFGILIFITCVVCCFWCWRRHHNLTIVNTHISNTHPNTNTTNQPNYSAISVEAHKFCTRCGQQVNGAFCGKCGQKL